MLLHHAIREYIKYLKLVERSDETVRGYEIQLQGANRYLDARHNCPVYLEDITLEDLEAFLANEKKRGMATASRRRTHYILRTFYNYCLKKELVSRNLPMLIEPVKVKQQERDYVTEEEFRKLSEAIPHPVIRATVDTMFYTGGRISEILNLELKDVDLNNRVIHILNGKGGKDRDIPMGDKLHTVLAHYLSGTRPETSSTRFFALKRTGKVSKAYVNRMIKEAAQEVGLKKELSAHNLRHSFGSNLLEKGVSVVSIQKLLGHANLTVTTRYLHQDRSKLTDAVNLL